MSAFETQVGGDHYKKLAIQPTQYAMANGLDACQFSVVKYVTRHKDKGGKKDLEKAMHFLQMLIELEYPEAMEVGPTIAPMDTNITETYGLFPQLRKKQTFPIPDADGWIEWTGKTDRPLWDGPVDVRFATGLIGTTYQLEKIRWSINGTAGDVVAWRPAKEQS